MNDKFPKPNRLAKELSPYLLQHAYNPVDWYAWCDEAFEKAVKEDKPIFLSIGYSTCHWCHVMEKESFEDQTTAKILNESFVPIKVDREERPDLDNIYMSVCQIMTGNGGWPLSLFLTPEKIPFYAGTYFPNVSRYGRISFNELLNKINAVWKTNRSEMEETSAEIFTILNRSMSDIKPVSIPKNIFETAYKYFSKNYDSLYGGFGLSPKFPSPFNLIFLIRYWKYFNEPAAINIVNKTLKEMHNGGIFDHIGFGFHRYSTDREWIIPHFEKMLYDQALMTLVYSEAFLATKNLKFKIAAEQILDYIMREMTSPLGGFYSAEDADSDGEEGKFYFWTNDDLSDCLNEEEKHFAMIIYNIGNGSEEKEKIPHLKNTFSEIANHLNLDINTFLQKHEIVRSKMFSYREKRMHPFKDDKILTDWNGLMIGSFANAGRIMNNSLYVSTAENAFHFIERNLIKNENKLLHRFRNGKKSIDANLDDYAFLVFSLIELYFTTYKAQYLTRAIELVDYIIEHFWDEEKYGFYFTPSYGEELISRTKDIHDAAIPSGNSMMLYNLSKLYRLTTDKRYNEYAAKTVDAFSELLTKTPFASTMFLSSYLSLISESIEVIIIGSPDDENIVKLLSSILPNYIPNLFIIIHNSENELYKLPFEYLGSYKQINESTTFYVCKNFICNLPTTSVEEALKQIKND